MDAAYAFESRWDAPAPPERCWPLLEGVVLSDRSWWPGVSVPDPPVRIAPGEQLTFRVRSPAGYVLRMRLRLTDVQPGIRIAAESTGDLEGTGSIELTRTSVGGSLITIRWTVTTRRAWMNATARVLRPVFVAVHDRVMRTGERALLAELASEVRNAGNPGESSDPPPSAG
ncbi:hypothetical protein LK09_10745 [Microbacterium mangrovi]|uniref:Polyketide cyclase n=1 Tax=Microbacterium mangrovi TaxID=1348253 RepID=A0A0B2A6S8_9MICO|nr:hypothetical protein [Microbacterium mangrovi]KHK97291.1 hypothetical protein LK09_10745 [Microbacterium mangrovi]